MPRTVNAGVYQLRRDAFLDSAQRLIQTKGYDAMSVQDVLDDLEASRGAFYHYFESKQELLEAVVDRFTDNAMAAVQPILDDPELPALPKLEKVVRGIASYKAESLELMLRLIDVLNSDGNVLFREKIRRLAGERLTPLLTRVIAQGVAEGSIRVDCPEDTARVLVYLVQGYQDAGARHFVARHAGEITFDEVRRTYAAFTRAFERILGLNEGSVTLADESTLQLWFG